MIYFILLRRFLNLWRDIIFAYLYIRPISFRKKPSLWSRTVTVFCLLVLLSMSFVDDIPLISNGSIRFLLRSTCFFLYIYVTKNISLSTMIYDALLVNTVCIVNHNLFLTPITRPILNAEAVFSSSPVLNELLCLLIVNAVSVLIYCLVYRYIPLKDIKNTGISRIIVLFLLAAESQYLNDTIKILAGFQPEMSVQFSIYMILLQLALLLCLVFIERYWVSLREQTRSQLENQAAHALLESIENQRTNETRIRRMRHDLKNHLTSIRYLIVQQKPEEAVRYIDQFLSEEVFQQISYHTGNDILDGILIQKVSVAQRNQIDVSISADFTYIQGIDGADLCIIFGNLFDNAIEACQKLDSSPRYINIRGQQIGESILYTMENSTAGPAILDHQLPITTKQDSLNHGIGLVSVKTIVLKNGGQIAFSASEHKFTVILTFPVSRKESS